MPVTNRTITEVIAVLKEEYKRFKEPIVSQIAYDKVSPANPFKILISTILSLRTKDETTKSASLRLFSVSATPYEMVKLANGDIEKLIYPVGFYKTKSKNIIDVCKALIEKYDGQVPDSIEELLTLKGVGRKTANLVVTLGYGKLGVCVDTHVHRISNRFGYVKTKTPEETEFALRAKLDKKYWIIYNDLLVSYGQNVCKPISPFCSKCRINEYCAKVGVTKSR